MLLIVTHKNIKNSIFLKPKNPITMHITAVIGFLFLVKIREIFIFNIIFLAFIKILSVGELPSHNHTASTNTTGNHNHYTSIPTVTNQGSDFGKAGNEFANSGPGRLNLYTEYGGNHSHTISISDTGSNQAHNNLSPYIAIYIWKRVN